MLRPYTLKVLIFILVSVGLTAAVLGYYQNNAQRLSIVNVEDNGDVIARKIADMPTSKTTAMPTLIFADISLQRLTTVTLERAVSEIAIGGNMNPYHPENGRAVLKLVTNHNEVLGYVTLTPHIPGARFIALVPLPFTGGEQTLSHMQYINATSNTLPVQKIDPAWTNIEHVADTPTTR